MLYLTSIFGSEIHLIIVTAPTQPQHNLNLTQLSWVRHENDFAISRGWNTQLLYTLFTNDLPEVVHAHADAPGQKPLHEEALGTVFGVGQTQQPPGDQGAQQKEGSLHEGQVHPYPHYNFKCQECGSLCIFADDSTFSASSNDIGQLKKTIKEKYEVIADYMGKNKLVLNSEKTHLLVMSSSRNHLQHGNFGVTLDTGKEKIEPGTEERLLGATVSNDFKWSKHVSDGKKSLVSILAAKINALRKVAK